MQKLEQYLDQVCRTIGGPVEMRQHVRQELREHLLDAIAQHKAAGMSEDDAMQKALDEFGKPDEVRSELEATHGQRMTWIIDKAMQWKERTMKAKWLWMTWAHLAVVLVIALELIFINFNILFIIPKFQKLMHDGIIDPAIRGEDGPSGMVNFLEGLSYVGGHYTTWILLGSIVLIALFEWRVKSENKSFIRLSAFGTVAVGLMVLVMMMAGALVICFCLGAPPAMARLARPWAVEQVGTIDTAIGALEQAQAKKDWAEMDKQAGLASGTLDLLRVRVGLSSLAAGKEAPTVEVLEVHVQTAREEIREVRNAIVARDAENTQAALVKFRKTFDPLRNAAKQPPR